MEPQEQREQQRQNDRVRLSGRRKIRRVPVLVGGIAAIAVTGILLQYAAGLDVLKLAQDLFMLKYLPKLGNDASYGLLFIFGVLTSFHCIGMCGGIAISQTVRKRGEDLGQTSQGKLVLLIPSALYNLGRVASYTLVGGIVGGLGQVLRFSGVYRSVVPITGGLFMIIMAVNLLNIFPKLRYLNIRMPSFFAKKVFKRSGSTYSPLIVGLLSGLMPCGPLQMAQLYALGTRSIVFGAASMFIFALGTVPILFLFGLMNTFITKNHSKLILRASAVLVLIMGIVMINRGLALAGINVELPHWMHMNKVSISRNQAVVKGGVQVVETSITSNSFPAITVQKGIPVKWNLHAEEKDLNDCNNAIVIPKLKIEKKLAAGDNYVEFTPKETGDIVFTCWMGMIRSKITVVDKLDSNAAAANTPSTTETQASGGTSGTSKMACETNQPGSVCDKTASATGNNQGITQDTGTKKVKSSANLNTSENSRMPEEKELTLKGVLQDRHCFGQVSPELDTKFCLQMKDCEASGYGIAVKQTDGTYKFYPFDQKGQVLAVQLLQKTVKDRNVTISVKGSQEKNVFKVAAIQEK